MYDVDSVAKYVVMYCNQQHKIVSNLGLQKILYFIQAEFLVTKKEPCFSEQIEAWDLGPVVPRVYHKYKVYGAACIPFVETNYYPPFTNEDRRLINSVIDACLSYSVSELVQKTHQQDPWKDAYSPYRRNPIPTDTIKQYFSKED